MLYQQRNGGEAAHHVRRHVRLLPDLILPDGSPQPIALALVLGLPAPDPTPAAAEPTKKMEPIEFHLELAAAA